MSSNLLHGFGALNPAVSLCYPFWLPNAIAAQDRAALQELNAKPKAP